MDAQHHRITRLALEAAARYGFALAGGYAVSAHGIGQRTSSDVDLFTDWPRRGDFPRAVKAIVAALEANRYTVSVVSRAETFARLLIDDQTRPHEQSSKLELSADWRSHDPVLLAIGPVLHPDDAVANKMCALFGRAAARDFLDVDAAILSGRYSRERLLELAAAADGGFDRRIFADAIGSLRAVTDAEFDLYDIDDGTLAAMRSRFAEWRDHLLAD